MRPLRPLLVVSGLSLCLGCSGDGRESPAELPDPLQTHGGDPKGATETNVAPVLCDSDADCPAAMRCVPFTPGETGGSCREGADAGNGGG